jgi:molybdopterin converting factor small subunit
LVVTVHLHTILQRQTPEGPLRALEVDLPQGSTLIDLLGKLEITLAGDDLLLVVNGRLAEEGQVLKEGDQVHLIPALSGGDLTDSLD